MIAQYKWKSLVLVCLAAAIGLGACRQWEPAPGASPGEDLYRKNCVTCHGVNGGGADGPSLIAREHSPEEIATKVRAGGSGMRSFDGELSADEIRQVSEYAASLSSPPEKSGG